MNSLKHAVVAVLLLGVSYAVYRAMTLPEANRRASEPEAIEGLVIETGSLTEFGHSSGEQIAAANVDRAPSTSPPGSTVLPPESRSFADSPNRVTGLPSPTERPATFSPTASPSADPRSTAPQLGGTTGRSSELPPTEGLRDRDFSLAAGPSQGGDHSVALVSGAPEPPTPLPPFGAAIAEVQQLAQAARYRDALAMISPYVQRGELVGDERRTLLEWADALALKVVYSTEHHLHPVHRTAAGETLDGLAAQWQVAPQLIYYINQALIRDQTSLPAGVELKKVTGPFRAEVRSADRELTLYVGELYAGRFALVDPLPASLPRGVFTISKKEFGSHPAGTYWMGTERSDVFLHAPGFGPSSGMVFSPDDARDLFGILSIGSQLVID